MASEARKAAAFDALVQMLQGKHQYLGISSYRRDVPTGPGFVPMQAEEVARYRWSFQVDGTSDVAAALLRLAPEIEAPEEDPQDDKPRGDAECNGCRLLRQHCNTAWNRGLTMGLASARGSISQATSKLEEEREAHRVTNATLTEALIAAEEENRKLRDMLERIGEIPVTGSSTLKGLKGLKTMWGTSKGGKP